MWTVYIYTGLCFRGFSYFSVCPSSCASCTLLCWSDSLQFGLYCSSFFYHCCKSLKLYNCWYLLASWKSAAMASSHHWDSCLMKGSSIRPRRKISWPAVRATVAIRLHDRIMSNCTWVVRREKNVIWLHSLNAWIEDSWKVLQTRFRSY